MLKRANFPGHQPGARKGYRRLLEPKGNSGSSDTFYPEASRKDGTMRNDSDRRKHHDVAETENNVVSLEIYRLRRIADEIQRQDFSMASRSRLDGETPPAGEKEQD
jgi:hypothetical protein